MRVLHLRRYLRPLRRRLGLDLNRYEDDTFLNYAQRKKIGLLAKADVIETLALRASTTDYGFFPSPSDHAYNLGLTSSDLHSTYYLYRNFRDALPRLRNIVIFGSVSTSGYCLARTRERYRCVAYRHFFGVPIQDETGFRRRIVQKTEAACRNLPPQDVGVDYFGYGEKTYYGTNIPAEARVATHLRENLREPDQMHWLQKTLDLAREAGHRVFIILPPCRSDYKAVLARSIAPDRLFQKFHDLDLGPHRIFDFYSAPDFGDDCMGDTDHLNREGARRVTAEIMRRIAGGQS